MKKILILGTGNAQVDIISHCKNRGLYVIATSNAHGGSGESLADEFFEVDITDVDATKRLAVMQNVDLIYSVGSDVAMPTVAEVSRDLKLPCPVSPHTAAICNHKQILRETLGDNIEGNIPHQYLRNADEEVRIAFPVMMKPSDSQGQRGVRRVDNLDELREHFDRTLSFSREKKVIIESFIDGQEISVNVFLEKGLIKFYLISDRSVWDEYPGGIIHEHIIPSRYEGNEAVCRKVRTLVENVLREIGLEDGPAYFQIKIDKDEKPFLIEVTPRLDGCHMWRLIEYSTGVNLLEAAVDMLEGRQYCQPAQYDVKPYSLEFLCGQPGTTFNMNNYEVPENVFMCRYYEEGQTIRSMNGYFEKCGYVIKEGTR